MADEGIWADAVDGVVNDAEENPQAVEAELPLEQDVEEQHIALDVVAEALNEGVDGQEIGIQLLLEGAHPEGDQPGENVEGNVAQPEGAHPEGRLHRGEERPRVNVRNNNRPVGNDGLIEWYNIQQNDHRRQERVWREPVREEVVRNERVALEVNLDEDPVADVHVQQFIEAHEFRVQNPRFPAVDVQPVEIDVLDDGDQHGKFLRAGICFVCFVLSCVFIFLLAAMDGSKFSSTTMSGMITDPIIYDNKKAFGILDCAFFGKKHTDDPVVVGVLASKIKTAENIAEKLALYRSDFFYDIRQTHNAQVMRRIFDQCNESSTGVIYDWHSYSWEQKNQIFNHIHYYHGGKGMVFIPFETGTRSILLAQDGIRRNWETIIYDELSSWGDEDRSYLISDVDYVITIDEKVRPFDAILDLGEAGYTRNRVQFFSAYSAYRGLMTMIYNGGNRMINACHRYAFFSDVISGFCHQMEDIYILVKNATEEIPGVLRDSQEVISERSFFGYAINENIARLFNGTDFSHHNVNVSEIFGKWWHATLHYSSETWNSIYAFGYDSVQTFGGNSQLLSQTMAIILLISFVQLFYTLVFNGKYFTYNINLVIVFYSMHSFLYREVLTYDMKPNVMVGLLVVYILACVIFVLKFKEGQELQSKTNNVLNQAKEMNILGYMRAYIMLAHCAQIFFAMGVIDFYSLTVQFLMHINVLHFQPVDWVYIAIGCCFATFMAIMAAIMSVGTIFLIGCAITAFCCVLYLFKDMAFFLVFVIVMIMVNGIVYCVYQLFRWFFRWLCSGFSQEENSHQMPVKITNTLFMYLSSIYSRMVAHSYVDYQFFVILMPLVFLLIVKASWVMLAGMICVILTVIIMCGSIFFIYYCKTCNSSETRNRVYDITYCFQGLSYEDNQSMLLTAYKTYTDYIKTWSISHLNANNKFNELVFEDVMKRAQTAVLNELSIGNSYRTSELKLMELALEKINAQLKINLADLTEEQKVAALRNLNAVLLEVDVPVVPQAPEIVAQRREMVPLNFDIFKSVSANQVYKAWSAVNALTRLQAAQKVYQQFRSVYDMTEPALIMDRPKEIGAQMWSGEEVNTGVTRNVYSYFDFFRTVIFPSIRDYIREKGISTKVYPLPNEEELKQEFKEYVITKGYALESDFLANVDYYEQRFGKNINLYINTVNKLEQSGDAATKYIHTEKSIVREIRQFIKMKNNVRRDQQHVDSQNNEYDRCRVDEFFRHIGDLNWKMPKNLHGVMMVYRSPFLYFSINPLDMHTSPYNLLEQKKNINACFNFNSEQNGFLIGHLAEHCGSYGCDSVDLARVVSDCWVSGKGRATLVFSDYDSYVHVPALSTSDLATHLFNIIRADDSSIGNGCISDYGGKLCFITALHNIADRVDGTRPGPGYFAKTANGMDINYSHVSKMFNSPLKKYKNVDGVVFNMPTKYFIRNKFLGDILCTDHEINGEVVISKTNLSNEFPRVKVGPISSGPMQMMYIDVVDCHKVPRSTNVYESNGVYHYVSTFGQSGAPVLQGNNLVGVHIAGFAGGKGAGFSIFDNCLSSTFVPVSFSRDIEGESQRFEFSKLKDDRDFRVDAVDQPLLKIRGASSYFVDGKNGDPIEFDIGNIKRFRDKIEDVLSREGIVKISKGNEILPVDLGIFKLSNFDDLERLIASLEEEEVTRSFGQQLIGALLNNEYYYSYGSKVMEQDFTLSPELHMELIARVGTDELERMLSMSFGELKVRSDNLRTIIQDTKNYLESLKQREMAIIESDEYQKMISEYKDAVRQYAEDKKQYIEVMAEHAKTKKDIIERKKTILAEKEKFHSDFKKILSSRQADLALILTPIQKDLVAKKEEKKAIQLEGLTVTDKFAVEKLEMEILEIDDQIKSLELKRNARRDDIKALKTGDKGENSVKVKELAAQIKEENEKVAKLNREHKLKNEADRKVKNEESQKFDDELRKLQVDTPKVPVKPVIMKSEVLKDLETSMTEVRKSLKESNQVRNVVDTILSFVTKAIRDDAIYNPQCFDDMSTFVGFWYREKGSDVREGLHEFFFAMISIAFERFDRGETSGSGLFDVLYFIETMGRSTEFNATRVIAQELTSRGIVFDDDDHYFDQSYEPMYLDLRPTNMNSKYFRDNFAAYYQPAAVGCSNCDQMFRCKQEHMNIEDKKGGISRILCTLRCYDTLWDEVESHKNNCKTVNAIKIPLQNRNDLGYGVPCYHHDTDKCANIRVCQEHSAKGEPCIDSYFRAHKCVIRVGGHMKAIQPSCLMQILLNVAKTHKEGECGAVLTDHDVKNIEKALCSSGSSKKSFYVLIEKALTVDLDVFGELKKPLMSLLDRYVVKMVDNGDKEEPIKQNVMEEQYQTEGLEELVTKLIDERLDTFEKKILAALVKRRQPRKPKDKKVKSQALMDDDIANEESEYTSETNTDIEDVQDVTKLKPQVFLE